MAPSVGKRFEQDMQNSCTKQRVFFQRLKDCGGWSTDPNTRFTSRNPFDCLIYARGVLLAVEMKSTKYDRFYIRNLWDSDKGTWGHQMSGLLAADQLGVKAGLLVEFRKTGLVEFFPAASVVLRWLHKTSALVSGTGTPIRRDLLRVRYRYQISEWLASYEAKGMSNTCQVCREAEADSDEEVYALGVWWRLCRVCAALSDSDLVDSVKSHSGCLTCETETNIQRQDRHGHNVRVCPNCAYDYVRAELAAYTAAEEGA